MQFSVKNSFLLGPVKVMNETNKRNAVEMDIYKGLLWPIVTVKSAMAATINRGNVT